MPVATLLQGIKALYATMGGMPEIWMDEVPEDHAATYPQCVLKHNGETPRPDAWDEIGHNSPITIGEWDFFLFAENDSDAVETLAVNLMTTFSPAALVVDFDSHLRCFRTAYKVSRATDRGTTAKPIYMAQISYRAQFGTDY